MTDGGAIDNNPAINGLASSDAGKRIFPGKKTISENASTIDRRKVRVNAIVTPATSGIRIYFGNYDLDDPSSDVGPIDAGGSAGGDNRGDIIGTPAGGQLSSTYADTDSSGVASVVFTVSMSPGNNFAIVAAKDSANATGLSVSGLSIQNGGNSVPIYRATNSPPPTSPSNPSMRTELLTTWRKLHIEVDSMSASTQNFTLGTVTQGATVAPGQTQSIVINQMPPENQYQDGRFVITATGSELEVVNNVPNGIGGSIVDVNNNSSSFPITIQSNIQFQMFDDDNFDDDAAGRNGDEGEDIPPPDMRLVADGGNEPDPNNPITNMLASAYVQTVHVTAAEGDISDNSFFMANAFGSRTDNIPMFLDYDLTGGDTDVRYWTVFVLGAYQPEQNRDGDPFIDVEDSILGEVDNITNFTGEGSGALIYQEMHRPREFLTYTNDKSSTDSEAFTVLHEIGHLFSLRHGDGGIMGINQAAFSPSIYLSDIEKLRIRNIDNP
jgi:hypothetical protein